MDIESTGTQVTILAHLGMGRYEERTYTIGTYTSEHVAGPRYQICREQDGALVPANIGGSYASIDAALALATKADAKMRAQQASPHGAPTIIYDDDAKPSITYDYVTKRA